LAIGGCVALEQIKTGNQSDNQTTGNSYYENCMFTILRTSIGKKQKSMKCRRYSKNVTI